jgi:hypothetical protein
VAAAERVVFFLEFQPFLQEQTTQLLLVVVVQMVQGEIPERKGQQAHLIQLLQLVAVLAPVLALVVVAVQVLVVLEMAAGAVLV